MLLGIKEQWQNPVMIEISPDDAELVVMCEKINRLKLHVALPVRKLLNVE